MPATPRRRLSIGQRLALGSAVILAMMVVLTLIGVNRVGVIRNSLVAIDAQHSVKQRQAINFRGSVHDRAIALRDVVLARSAAERQAALAEFRRLADSYAEAQRVLDGLLSGSGVLQKERELAAAIREVEQRTLPLASAVIAAQQDGRTQEAQALLLDAHVEGFGGAGKVFDWSRIPTNVNAHLVLSGGLTPANVGDGIAQVRPRALSLAVDVSSGVEASKGIKDAGKIFEFVAAVRAADERLAGPHS